MPRAVEADAIVVAAGSSSRMGGVDKLTTALLGQPVLAWSVGAIAAAAEVERIVLVVPPDPAIGARLTSIARSAAAGKLVGSAVGGSHRGASVEAGLAELERLDPGGGDRPLLVHDGARPAVRSALVSAVARATAVHGTAVPVVAVSETLKRIEGDIVTGTVDRSGLATAQTPQGASRQLLREGFRRFPTDGPTRFTDEAALLEACRIVVHALPGDPTNRKVTLPADLDHAAVVLAAGVPLRVGLGSDSHPFGPGDGLRLGGIEIAGVGRLRGHSDGDAALHAVADALLGAAAMGDLGRLFPADARTPAGIPSRDLLAAVVHHLARAGWAPAGVDLVIEGARPRLGPRLDAMAEAIAAVLGIDRLAVSVKASSGNLDGATGAGRVIAARAIATIRPRPATGTTAS